MPIILSVIASLRLANLGVRSTHISSDIAVFLFVLVCMAQSQAMAGFKKIVVKVCWEMRKLGIVEGLSRLPKQKLTRFHA